MMNRKILQIIPASNYQAVYMDEGKEIFIPLACWALVDEEDQGETLRYVVGIEATDNLTSFCDEASNFLRYEFAKG